MAMEASMPTGATDAFDRAVLEEISTIRAIGKERLYRRDDVDDFAQEVVLRAYAYRDQARHQDTVGAWVRAIARNTAMNWNARRRPTACAEFPDLPDTVLSAARQLASAEERGQLTDALSLLNETDRALLVAHVVDGEPYAALMERHGLSRTAVGVRLHRARARLRRSLRHAVGAALAWRGSAALGGVAIVKVKWTVGIGAAAIAGALALGGLQLMTDRGTGGSSPGSGPFATSGESSALGGGAAPAPGRRAPQIPEHADAAPRARSGGSPTPDDQAATVAAGSGRDQGSTVVSDPLTGEPAAGSERYLYGEFARVYPLYMDAVERYTRAIGARPKSPGSAAPEDEQAAWRVAFRAHRRDVMDPIGADIRYYEDEIQRLFPAAVTVVDDPERGRVWTLDEDAVRSAVGGRLPNEASGG